MEIIARNLAELHEKAVYYVLRFGTRGKTEDGEDVITAPPVSFIVEEPTKGRQVSDWNNFKGTALVNYVDEVLYGTKSKFVYDYHDRLFNTPCNQVEACIKRINHDLRTRRAVMHTWIPEVDNDRKDVPCLQYVQFWVDENRLNMFVLFRSNDVLSALGANIVALTALQTQVACACKLVMGSYTHSIVIPHIYYRRDANLLMKATTSEIKW